MNPNVVRILAVWIAVALAGAVAVGEPGDWPEPRQNPRLTGLQPLPGRMAGAPHEAARIELPRTAPAVRVVEAPESEGGWAGLALVAGGLERYGLAGDRLWRSQPPGLNFTKIEAVGDFDGDGRREAALMAGRSAEPYGAAVLVALDDGTVLWRYDVEPMSYAWYLHVGQYLPQTPALELVVLMQGYPPDRDNGYLALFAYGEGDPAPVQRWRYDFDAYTCFPSFLQTDLDGDGVDELVVQTHSRMWFLDAATGTVKHFIQWDVSPANVRSYGRIEFVDLDGDGRDDFLCIADFAQHHEVLLNRDGRFDLAWVHGWPESVTTRHVATTWPEPPYGDLDGDGRLEVVVSMFNSEGEEAWLTRVYDARTGGLRYRARGLIAVALHDCDGDGTAEILANASSDPTGAELRGARLLTLRDGRMRVLWKDDQAQAVRPEGGATPFLVRGDRRYTLTPEPDGLRARDWVAPATQEKPAIVPSAVVGPQPMPDLLAVQSPDGMLLVVYGQGEARLYSVGEGEPALFARFPSDAVPVAADFDGDGRNDLATVRVSETAPPRVEVHRISADPGPPLWARTLPETDRTGFPHGRPAYLRAGRFTGGDTPDLYLWAGTPLGRAVLIDGRTGDVLWERGEFAYIERYCAPTVNLASVYDLNGDGREDLVFTAPDYYCVADGPTGALLLGPLFPPDIFRQPSQGLYTFPALLEGPGEPLVALVSGHYFQGVMTLRADPRWHALPAAGEARCAQEAFLRLPDGSWLMGFGRQNGRFACVNAGDGSLRWEWPLEASASDAAVCDVDGDGRLEFVFGTSHGALHAIGDDDGKPRVVWTADLGIGVGPLICADLDGDGASEIALCTADGYVRVFAPPGDPQPGPAGSGATEATEERP